MSFSHYDEHGARTSHHTHCCIGARRATHYATEDDECVQYYPKGGEIVACVPASEKLLVR